jgi:hypothetical protein
MVRMNTLFLLLNLNAISFSTFSVMLGKSPSYVVFIMLSHGPYIPNFFKGFIMKRCSIFSMIFCIYGNDCVIFLSI